MAIFDNTSYGISPQFNTSPETIKMNFFSNVDALGGLISAKNTASQYSSENDGKPIKALKNQQIISARDNRDLKLLKQAFVSKYMQKASEMVSNDPSLSMTQAVTSLSAEMRDEMSEISEMEIQVKANDELYERNVTQATKDREDKTLMSQYTIATKDGNEMLFGYDKNNNPTNDPNKIERFITNSDYYEMQEKALGRGTVYTSPIKIDLEKGTKFISDSFKSLGNTTNEWSYENFASKGQQQAFQAYFGKFAMSTQGGIDSDNIEQLQANAGNLLSFMPKEVRLALTHEYIDARQKGLQINVVDKEATTQKRLKDKNAKEVVKQVDLSTEDFNKGLNMYTTAKIYHEVDPNRKIISKRTNDFDMYDDGTSGNGNGNESNNTNMWHKIAYNQTDGAETVLFNNPYISPSEESYATELQKWNERQRASFKKDNINWTDDKIDAFLKSPANIQNFEKFFSKPTTSWDKLTKIAKQKEVSQNGFGGLFVKGEGKESNSDIVFYGGSPYMGNPSREANSVIRKNSPYYKTSIPLSEKQITKNYGQGVVKWNISGNELRFGSAAVGAKPQSRVYSEGMNEVPQNVIDGLVLLSLDAVYQGVERPNGSPSNALAQGRYLIHKDKLKDLDATLFANGEFKKVKYDHDKFVKATLGIEELNEDEIALFKEPAVNAGNEDGAKEILRASTDPSDYRVVTLYQDFQSEAETLAVLMAQRKDLLGKKENATNGENRLMP